MLKKLSSEIKAMAEIKEKKIYTTDEIKRLAPGYKGKAENFDPAKTGKKNTNAQIRAKISNSHTTNGFRQGRNTNQQQQ